MRYQGTERRDITPKGKAVREHVREALAEYEASRSCDSIFMEFTASELARMFGRLWTTAYAQGRADLARDMRDDFDAKLRALLEEYGVR